MRHYPFALLVCFPFTLCGLANAAPVPEEAVWTLDCRVTDLRTITVEVPEKGKKTYWYLRYEIVNNTDAARTITPTFELMEHNRQVTHTQVLRPNVFKAICKQEDPDGKVGFKDATEIGQKALETSKSIHGIAVWEDVDPKATHVSVFVVGLSNGKPIVRLNDKKELRCKTLQVNFKLNGETFKHVPDPQWLYRLEKKAIEGTETPTNPKFDKHVYLNIAAAGMNSETVQALVEKIIRRLEDMEKDRGRLVEAEWRRQKLQFQQEIASPNDKLRYQKLIGELSDEIRGLHWIIRLHEDVVDDLVKEIKREQERP
jgi:hypothetical protein